MTAAEARWLGAITSAAVIILGIRMLYIYVFLLVALLFDTCYMDTFESHK